MSNRVCLFIRPFHKYRGGQKWPYSCLCGNYDDNNSFIISVFCVLTTANPLLPIPYILSSWSEGHCTTLGCAIHRCFHALCEAQAHKGQSSLQEAHVQWEKGTRGQTIAIQREGWNDWQQRTWKLTDGTLTPGLGDGGQLPGKGCT